MKTLSKKIIIYCLSLAVLTWTIGPVLPVWADEIIDPPENPIEETEGETTTNPPPEDNGDVDVETGDVGGQINIENEVNLNETELNSGDPGEGEEEEECLEDCELGEEEEECLENCEPGEGEEKLLDSVLEECELEECEEVECEEGEECLITCETEESEGCDGGDVIIDEDILEVTNDNEADVENNVEGEGNSGNNIIDENLGDVNLETGEIQLISNIFNLINLNIVGSSYLTLAYNLVGNIIGDLDLSRYQLDSLAEEVETNDEFKEFLGDYQGNNEEVDEVDIDVVDITNENEAEVDNDVDLDAISGENDVFANGGDVKIVTGNISVASNLVNIVNTNIIGDGWTLVIINIVGNWVGDLVLPSLTNYIASQQSDFSLDCDDESECADVFSHNETVIQNNNEAEVNNDVTIIGNSGDNGVADNDGDVNIQTGDVTALSQVSNVVNTNILSSGWVYGSVNVVGNWLGGFYGQPDEGFELGQIGNHWTFSYDPTKPVELVEPDSPELSVVSDPDSNVDVLHVTNNNQAVINNKINIFADSGGNLVGGNGGDVDIQTGDVYALSNILNLVNSNIIGDNWTYATVNVIGNWEGNMYFGKPDLTIMEVASAAPDPAELDGTIEYVLTILNKGDARANNVKLFADYDDLMVDVLESDGGEVTDGNIVWDIPTLEVGEMVTKTYRVGINAEKIDANNITDPTVTSITEVMAAEADRNEEDNESTTTVLVGGMGGPKMSGFGHPVQAAGMFGLLEDDEFEHDTSNPVFSDWIRIKKSNNSDGLIRQGQSVIYTLELFNNTENLIKDVYVYDVMTDPNGETISEQRWLLDDVMPYEQITIDYTIAFADDAPYGTYKNRTWSDGFAEDNSYLIFPEKTNLVVIRQPLNQADLQVNLEYNYEQDKVLNEEYKDVVVLTNQGELGLPQGKLIVIYDDKDLQISGEEMTGSTIIVPSINPGESIEISLSSVGLSLTDRTQIDFVYLVDEVPAVMTSFFQRISDVKVLSYQINDERLENSANFITELNENYPRVLGVSEVWADSNIQPDQLDGGLVSNYLNDLRVLLIWILLVFTAVGLSWFLKHKHNKV